MTRSLELCIIVVNLITFRDFKGMLIGHKYCSWSTFRRFLVWNTKLPRNLSRKGSFKDTEKMNSYGDSEKDASNFFQKVHVYLALKPS